MSAKPYRDAKFHGQVQESLQHFVRWSVVPEESPTGKAPSRQALDGIAQIAADADPNGGQR
jgi:hypothetical protein